MHNICFTISFILCPYMFRAHVLIIRRSKLHYTTSGNITPIGGRLVHETATYRGGRFFRRLGSCTKLDGVASQNLIFIVASQNLIFIVASQNLIFIVTAHHIDQLTAVKQLSYGKWTLRAFGRF